MSGDLRSVDHPPRLQSLKAASKALIRAAGGQEAAAAETGRSQARLSAYGGPNTPDFMPIDIVLALESVTHGTPGHPLLSRLLAREAGFVLVKLPTSAGNDQDWHQAMAAVSKETSEIIERVCHALRDQKVTAAEIRDLRLREEIADAQEKLAALDALALRALEEND